MTVGRKAIHVGADIRDEVFRMSPSNARDGIEELQFVFKRAHPLPDFPVQLRNVGI